MNRQQLLSLFAFVLLAVAARADKPTVDSVLDRYVKEIGGKEAVEKTKTVLGEGDIEAGGATGKVKLMRKAPNKVSWSVDIDGSIYAQGYDGSKGWKQDPSGVESADGRELRVLKRDSVTPEQTGLKTAYPNLQYKGLEKVNGEEAHILESSSSSVTHRLAFSNKTGLLIGRTTSDGDIKSVATIGNYKPVEGVLRPFTISETLESPNGSFEWTIRVSKYAINGDLKDSVFAEPKQ